MLIKKEFVDIRSKDYDNYNNNNILELTPFNMKDGFLEIEEEQYDAWSETDGLTLLEVEGFKVKKVENVEKLTEKSEWYYKVYNTILSRANASRWYHLIDNAHFFEFKDIEEIDKIPVPEKGWFVKTGFCSTKNDNIPPVPVFNSAEAKAHLLASKKTSANLDKGILFRPWVDNINFHNEIRVFVKRKKIIGVSQQHFYRYSEILRHYEAEDIVQKCQRCYDDFNSKLEPSKRFNYECTFDAYIDENGDVKLIEINSEMLGWGPAGASLFSWTEDFILDNTVYFLISKV